MSASALRREPVPRRLRRAAAVLPEAVDQHRRDRQLLDQRLALLVAVDPLGEVVVLVAERERLDREDPVARVLGVVERLPLVVAQLDARHVALAPRGALGRRALGCLRRRLGHVEQRLEARRRLGQRALDADHVPQHQRHDPLRLLAAGERGRRRLAAFAPHAAAATPTAGSAPGRTRSPSGSRRASRGPCSPAAPRRTRERPRARRARRR